MSEWENIKANKQGIILNNVFTEEFLKELETEFNDKDVNLIQIGISLTDKNIDSNNENAEKIKLIEISNRTFKDTLEQKVTLNCSDEEILKKLEKLLDKFNKKRD